MGTSFLELTVCLLSIHTVYVTCLMNWMMPMMNGHSAYHQTGWPSINPMAPVSHWSNHPAQWSPWPEIPHLPPVHPQHVPFGHTPVGYEEHHNIHLDLNNGLLHYNGPHGAYTVNPEVPTAQYDEDDDNESRSGRSKRKRRNRKRNKNKRDSQLEAIDSIETDENGNTVIKVSGDLKVHGKKVYVGGKLYNLQPGPSIVKYDADGSGHVVIQRDLDGNLSVERVDHNDPMITTETDADGNSFLMVRGEIQIIDEDVYIDGKPYDLKPGMPIVKYMADDNQYVVIQRGYNGMLGFERIDADNPNVDDGSRPNVIRVTGQIKVDHNGQNVYVDGALFDLQPGYQLEKSDGNGGYFVIERGVNGDLITSKRYGPADSTGVDGDFDNHNGAIASIVHDEYGNKVITVTGELYAEDENVFVGGKLFDLKPGTKIIKFDGKSGYNVLERDNNGAILVNHYPSDEAPNTEVAGNVNAHISDANAHINDVNIEHTHPGDKAAVTITHDAQGNEIKWLNENVAIYENNLYIGGILNTINPGSHFEQIDGRGCRITVRRDRNGKLSGSKFCDPNGGNGVNVVNNYNN